MPAPIQAGKRWVVRRIHPWTNDYGKLARRAERGGEVVDLNLSLARIVTPPRPAQLAIASVFGVTL